MTEITIKPGNYFTVPASGIAPALIRWGTRSPVAHAVVYVGMQPNGYDCIQAEPGGIGWTSINHWNLKPIYWSKRQLTDQQSAAMAKTALSLVGVEYSFLLDTLLGVRDALRIKVPHWLFKLVSKIKHMDCSQTADYVGMLNGVNYFNDGRNPGEVTPGDLYHLDYK